MRYNLYPRGYMSAIDPPGTGGPEDFIAVNCDSRIQELFQLASTRSVNTDGWVYQRQALIRIAQLFGDFRSWLTLQLMTNDNIYGANLEFLRDTVQFIRTGRRDTSILTYFELLLEHPDQKPGIANHARVADFKLVPGEFDNFIGKWCSHQGGFEDILCTAHVLFGMSKHPLVSLPL